MNSLGRVGGRREQNKAETRLAIQRAAVELFEEQGYDDTTVDDIAGRAGVAPRTFFRYFPSKELTLFSEDVSGRMAELVAAAPVELAPLDVLEHALARLLEDEPSELDRRRQALRQRLRTQPGVTRQFNHIQEITARRLHEAFRQRFVDAGADRPDLLADAVVAIHVGLAGQLHRDATNPETFMHWLDAVRTVVR